MSQPSHFASGYYCINKIRGTAGKMYLLCCFLRWIAVDFKISAGIEEKRIHVSSHTQISVFVAYITPSDPYFQDASEMESVASSQTSFYILNHINGGCFSDIVCQFFGISASQSGTVVNITSPETQLSLTLNLYETYSEMTEDLTGYHVSSSAPVTVISGNLYAINAGSSTYGSYISTHRPVDQYSTEFLVPAIEAPHVQNSGYDVHVVASQSSTVVNIDSDIHDLDEGEIIVVQFPGRTTPASITCSLPCNVVQFSKRSTSYDGLFMINVLPSTDFYTSAVFSTSQSSDPFYITVVVDSSTAVNDLVLDGVIFSPVWTKHENYIYAHETVSQGYHKMTSSDSHFALYTYSHTGRFGGGYGFAVRPKKGKGLYVPLYLF